MEWGIAKMYWEKIIIIKGQGVREKERGEMFLHVPVSQNRACSCINVRYTACS